ncbi:MAG: ParB N-terminal domain-containing protein [Bacilli bacterium]|nr:ParB N-terminal domain-containing protein [Bacilli bacterium]
MSILTIGRRDYEVEEREINQVNLLFYPDNPRVYSHFISADEKPSQKDIEEIMVSLDHVKQLKLSIESNGGLIDPLLVRDGDLVVLEGNSRLAAYRILSRNDPIKWGKIKCIVLPADIDDSAIFGLLGQYHIVGRKDWSPYEQAGYLYRRHKDTKLPIEYMAQELGITKDKAQKFIRVYEFMLDNNDSRSSKWSYYEEYLKSPSINKAREKYPCLDNTIVEWIKTDSIKEATDIRKISELAKFAPNDKKINKYFEKMATGEENLYDTFEAAKDTGKHDDVAKKLSKIRREVNTEVFAKKALAFEDKGSLKFEIKKILNALNDILKKIDN